MENHIAKNILLVEDDAVVVEIYRKKLQREGFTVNVAQDGLEAMKHLTSLKPDLVVLDLMMPKFNGADVLKFIRAHKDLKATKVIIFTNAYMTELAQEASKAGADRSVLKSSATPAQLIGVIHELLNEAVTPAKSEAPASAQPEALVELPARKAFLEGAPQTLKGIREAFEAFAQATEPRFQNLRLEDLHRRIHFLGGVSSVADCHQISHLAGTLEALLFELQERPKNITPSVIQTIHSTVDFLGVLLTNARHLAEQSLISPTTLLVVDDDDICNRALVHALGRAKLRSTSAVDPFVALTLLKERHYDLILLDYFMPGMDGLELCTKVRALPDYARTPIIFITSASDFRQRAQNILRQGDDVITKPIFPIELALKALTVLMKRQLEEHLAKK